MYYFLYSLDLRLLINNEIPVFILRDFVNNFLFSIYLLYVKTNFLFMYSSLLHNFQITLAIQSWSSKQ